MAILDSRGRLFGKVSILDVGAGLIILMVVVGVFFFPGTSGSVAQLGTETKTVEVDMALRGLVVTDPPALMAAFKTDKTINVIIRNQPSGQMQIKGVQPLPRSVAVPQPDGSVKSFPDPRPELNYTMDFILTMTGTAQITKTGAVIANSKIKLGTPIEVEGSNYNLTGSVVGLRIQ